VATHYRHRATSEKIKLDNNEKLERKRTYDQIKRKENFKQAGRKTATG
jgi:hypothetical protein